MAMFKPATRKKLKLRMALCGPSGSGKTYSALRFAAGLANGGRIAVIDTEHRSASKYLGESPDGTPWQFDVCEIVHFAPTTYTQVIKEAGAAGYDVLVIDGLSQAWEGLGGALDQVDKKSDNGGNSFTAWRDVTPQHRQLIETILACPCHVIATMRTKMEYVLEDQVDQKTGKTKKVPRKVGMAPIQRAGMEYEFDVVGDLDLDHVFKVTKTRCPAIDGATIVRPNAGFMDELRRWLDHGTEAVEPVAATEAAATEETMNPAHKMLDEALDRASQPCSQEHKDRIIELAEQLAGADGVAELVKAACKKRGVKKIGELTEPQAATLIKNLEEAVAAKATEATQEPPFDAK